MRRPDTALPGENGHLRLLRTLLGWTTLAVVGSLALLAMLVTPGMRRRRILARLTARTVLAAAGIKLAVTLGKQRIQLSRHAQVRVVEAAVPESCVIIANHTSYLDGVILTALLPPRFAFVIKKEMSRVPLAGALLQRIGSEFVDRFNRQRGAMDARRVLRRTSGGEAMVFFPEGTFPPGPGLLRFHSGAFVAAMRAGCPVIPVAIRGARHAFTHARLLVNPGTIEVQILPAVCTHASTTDATTRLRDEVRSLLLEQLGEPDLAVSSHVATVLPADLVERV